jgi:hypothetical protein
VTEKATKRLRTGFMGIVCQLRYLQAKGWHQVVWGDPSNGVLGRVPKGIQEARKWNASTIVFSTGASEKGGIHVRLCDGSHR